jgi:hypothetical protein
MRSILLGILGLATLGGAAMADGAAPVAERSKDWMRQARYGVFFHFLPGGPDYQKQIDSFDTEAFADQMVQAGAGYVYITLGQNNGWYLSPNRTYEKLVGCKPFEKCSKRDLPMDLSKSLSRRHIRMCLYLPSRAPQQDANAMAALHDVNEQKPAPQEFVHLWGEVIREWSLRYKNRVSGWWFDGSYNTAGWDDLSKPYSWTTWAAATRAGNPNSLLAFNPGTDLRKAFTALCAEQDYTAGEQNEWVASPSSYPAPKGVQWQILTFLGKSWSTSDGLKSSDSEVIEAIRKINSEGGAVTMDVHVDDHGIVYPPAMAQLIAIRKAIRGN